MARTITAKNGHVCTYWQSALGALSEVKITFPRGVNRVIISSGTAGPFAIQWRPDHTSIIAPTDGGSPATFAEATGGVRVVAAATPAAIIEVEEASSLWTFRNLGAGAASLFIEGHVIGGAE